MADNWWSNPGFKKLASEGLQDLGYGLANSTNFGNAFGAATTRMQQMEPYRAEMAQQEEAEAKLAEQGNVTRSWLEQQGFTDLLPLVDAGETGLAYNEALKRMQPGYGVPDSSSAPSNVQEWEYYSQLTPEQQSQYLTMKRSNSPLNIGTGFVTQDMANPGQTIGAPIAINNQQEAFDKGYGAVTGTAAGEVDVLANSVSSKMPGLRSVVDTLSSLADTATYTQSGQAMDSVKRELGLPVGQGAIDRASYIAIVDNQVLPLLRDTFGAAFTQKEGETLRATLGDPNKSPAEKKAILNAFIAQKERDVAAMQGQGVGSGGYTVLGVE